jgi:2-iminoacetate synthase ThiH
MNALISGANVIDKVLDGERITKEEALELYRLPIEEIGALADHRRKLAKAGAYGGRGNEIVTYIVERNINYECPTRSTRDICHGAQFRPSSASCLTAAYTS